MVSTEKTPVELGYDAVYEAMPGSPTLRRLWRELASGTDFPEDFYHISFVTLPQHERMVKELRLSPGDTLVDVACGMGGPALLAAKNTGAKLVGVDISSVAVRRANERAASLGMSDSAKFVVGTFAATGLDSASADGVMSEDALQYVPDKTAALKEIARILRPGKRLVCVAFELNPEAAATAPGMSSDPVTDYRPLLEATGFDIQTYEEIPGCPDPVRNTYQTLLDNRDALIPEMGAVAAAALFSELTLVLQTGLYQRRVLMVASKRA
jgi:ubiquinone/menaquinone biosynthesis C-methylase UbiE